MHDIIEVNNLSKSFQNHLVLENISFSLARGMILGLVGPNGAGKTTLLRVLTGTLRQTSGTVTVLHKEIPRHAEEIKKHIGYVSQKRSLYQNLTVDENFYFYAGLYGVVNDKWLKKQKNSYFEKFKLSKYQKTLTRKLSGGYQQRLAIVCSLIHTPKILYLDEPTVGLDPVTRKDLWDYFYYLSREKNITLLVTTHYMEEVTRCDRVAFLNKGKLLGQGSIQEILENLSLTNVYDVFLEQPYRLVLCLRDLGFELVYEYGNRLRSIGISKRELGAVARGNNITIDEVKEASMSVEDIFFYLNKKN